MASVNIHSGTSDTYSWNNSSNIGTGRNIVETVDGIPYAVMRNDSGTPAIEVWKGNASTPTSFSEQDGANAPSSSQYLAPSCAIDSTGIIHIVYYDSNGKNSALRYVTFDTNTDTFSGDTSIYDIGSASPGVPATSIALNFDDRPHVAWVDVNSNMGTDYDTVYYGNLTGVSWSTEVEVEGQANQKICRFPSICITHENYPSICYVNGTDTTVVHATSTASDPSSFTITDRDTSVDVLSTAQATSIIQRNTTTWFAYVDSDNSIAVYEGATVRDTGRTGHKPQITLDASGNITVFYIDTSSGSGNVTYSTWNGSTWDTEVDAETGSFDSPKTVGSFRIIEGYYGGGTSRRNDSTAGTHTYTGQSFTGNGGWIHAVRVRLRYVGSVPTGTFIARIFAHTGTYGTNSQWTGSALASSATVGASLAGTSFKWVTFRFTTPYQTTDGTKYVVRIDGNSASGETYIETDTASSTHGGNLSRTNYLGDPSVSQTPSSTEDLTFILIGTGGRVMYGWDAGADLYWNELTASGVYTIPISAGSYTYTGSAVNLEFHRKIPITAGSYAYTGTAVTLSKGKKIIIDSGSYTYTGTAVTLKWFHNIPINAGSYAYTGTDVNLEFHRVMPVDAGSYAYTGTAVTLDLNKAILIDSGSYAYTGTDVNLEWHHVIPVNAGSYAYTGTDVALSKGKVILIDAGSYTYTGTDINLEWHHVMPVTAGSYAYTGTDVNLEFHHVMPVTAGAYAYTGTDVALSKGQVILIDAGSYAYTGTDINLEWHHVLTASGTYAYTGTAVTLTYTPVGSYTIVCDAGSYAYTGSTVNLEWHHVLTASGVYTYSGTNVNLEFHRVMPVTAGAYVYTGTNVALSKGRVILIDAGSYAYTGANVNLEWHHVMPVNAGTYTYTGTNVNLEFHRVMPVLAGAYSYTGTNLTFSRGYTLTANAGSYVYTGSAVNLEWHHVIPILAGAYAYAGTDITLARGRTMTVDAGAYTYTGSVVNLEWHHVIPINVGAYLYTGSIVNLDYSAIQEPPEIVRSSLLVTGRVISQLVSRYVKSEPVTTGKISSNFIETGTVSSEDD